MNTPSADAIRLAVNLSGHNSCEVLLRRCGRTPCEACLADAATIDRELLLPEKHAALLLAQGVIDARDSHDPNWYANTEQAIDQLRDALAKIKTT
jgi:hypothetical protein